ncbi:MAG: phosphopantetheine-binding protein [Oscillospiraceae bacterium]|jgi:acyl carrier protein|nr:phosphopantetheine-binding protein [Oscillospiraceae bacterium]
MRARLQELFNDYTGRDDVLLREESVILRDLGLNSYELVNLIVEAEDRFGVELPDRAILKIRTIGDLIALLEEQGVAL